MLSLGVKPRLLCLAGGGGGGGAGVVVVLGGVDCSHHCTILAPL